MGVPDVFLLLEPYSNALGLATDSHVSITLEPYNALGLATVTRLQPPVTAYAATSSVGQQHDGRLSRCGCGRSSKLTVTLDFRSHCRLVRPPKYTSTAAAALSNDKQ